MVEEIIIKILIIMIIILHSTKSLEDVLVGCGGRYAEWQHLEKLQKFVFVLENCLVT